MNNKTTIISRSIPGKVNIILNAIGLHTDDFSETEMDILVALANKDLEFNCNGRHYNYTLAGIKIFEVNKPRTCDDCPVKAVCTADCTIHKEYDIVQGLREIRSKLDSMPYKIYYVSPDYTVIYYSTRIYASSISYMGLINLREFRDASSGCNKPGKYKISTEIDIVRGRDMLKCSRVIPAEHDPISSFNPLARIEWSIGERKYHGVVRNSILRTGNIKRLKATVFFEVMPQGDIFIPLITEEMGEII